LAAAIRSNGTVMIETGLSPGCRIPDVYWPTADGGADSLFARFCGGPLVLALTIRPDLVTDCLTQLGRLMADQDRGRLCIIHPQGRPVNLPGCETLADDGQLFAALLGAVPPVDRVTLFVFDSGLRLVARQLVSGDIGDEERGLLLRNLDRAACTPTRPAPVLRVPGILEPDLCQALIDQWGQDHTESVMIRMRNGEPAAVRDDPAKRRSDHRLADGPLQDQVASRLRDRLLPDMAMALGHRVERYEPFKIVSYQAGSGWFRRHRDNVEPATAHRRFALTLGLNDGYAGGNLLFPEFDATPFRPEAGEALVFSCSLLHELTDVTAGQRFALISFF
jgi:predicted 2-oxoglutarate/Fe(II)-dependent dioxygenase YbiX